MITVAELDRGEDEAGAEDGALSFSLSSIRLVKSQTGCLTITLRYHNVKMLHTSSRCSRPWRCRLYHTNSAETATIGADFSLGRTPRGCN
eukprot:SAG11_NODE_1719_length_4381_cov_8.257823_3_plen_90_part_00